MKITVDFEVGGKTYPKGTSFPWYFIYPFFLIHILVFGLTGFFMAYSSSGPGLIFLYLHGGFAIVLYTIFYLVIFGLDSVRWMFINAGLGLFGIYAQINWILSWFGKRASDYSWETHLIPFLYYVLYTFLLYQMLLDISGARNNPLRRRLVEGGYVVASLLIYATVYLKEYYD